MKVLFQKYYILSDKITVDETMIPSKSRQIMKQYMPMKPIKWGFKLHCLTDASNNYLYDYIFDPGKNTSKSWLQRLQIQYNHMKNKYF